jgi:hypothetical protein
MRSLRVAPFLLAALLVGSAQAFAQCPDWKAGPLEDSEVGNGANGFVLALISWDPDDAGPLAARLVAGGDFDSIGGRATGNIAYLDPATGQWEPFTTPSPFTEVGTLAHVNGKLYAGTGRISGSPGLELGRWTGSNWASVGGGACLPDYVNMAFEWATTLGAFDGKLVLGGELVAWAQVPSGPGCTGQGGRAVGVSPDGFSVREEFGPISGDAYAIAQYGTQLFVGGTGLGWPGDLQIGGHKLAAWNGAAWSAAGIDANGTVRALQPWNGGLVAGGSFTTIGGVAADGIAFYNGTSWQPLGSGVLGVSSMTVYRGELIVSGGFNFVGGVEVNYIARWNGSAWAPLGSGLSGAASALTVHNGELIAGGVFSSAGSKPANFIARWDGSQWSSFGGGTVASVEAFTVMGTRLVAGGIFQQSTRTVQPALNIVSWDGTGLSAFGTGLGGEVSALESFKYPGINGATELIAGGEFTQAGGALAARIARWVESPLGGPPPSWQAMGAGFNGDVRAIERHASATYAGGYFSSSGVPVNFVARWNETTDVWEPLGSGLSGPVLALKSFNRQLYAGGLFATAGGVSTGGLARWNGSSWSAVGGYFDGNVYSLEVHQGELVIGGFFSSFPGSPNLVKFDGTSFSTLGTGGANSYVRALYSDGTRLYAGGEFTRIGGVDVSRAAFWDGTWQALPGSPSLPVKAIFGHRGEVHFGGIFDDIESGATPSPGWARFTASGRPRFAAQPLSRTVDSRTDASFAAEVAAGYDDATLRWHKNGVPLADGPTISGSTIVGAGTKALFVQRVAQLDAGSYRLVATNACGSESTITVTLTVNQTVDVADALPGATLFEAIGPNPAQGTAWLAFALARPAAVRMGVHDIAGRLVRKLDLGTLPAGRHRTLWDGRGDSGAPVPAGVYIVTFAVDGRAQGARRVTMLR